MTKILAMQFVSVVLLLNGPPAAANLFWDAPFSMHADFGTGIAFGPATFEERDMFQVNVFYDNGDELTGKPYHFGFRMGPRIDITPWRMKNRKLGVRVGYDYGGILQHISVGDDYHEAESWNGWLVKRHNILFGPLFIFGKAIGIRQSIFGTLFVLNGPNLGGNYSPAPGAQDYGAVNSGQFDSAFGGWRIDVGVGIGGNDEHLLFGVNLVWTANIIALDEKVYLNVSQTTLINELNFSAYVGFLLP